MNGSPNFCRFLQTTAPHLQPLPSSSWQPQSLRLVMSYVPFIATAGLSLDPCRRPGRISIAYLRGLSL